jgi:hypothetical protein
MAQSAPEARQPSGGNPMSVRDAEAVRYTASKRRGGQGF